MNSFTSCLKSLLTTSASWVSENVRKGCNSKEFFVADKDCFVNCYIKLTTAKNYFWCANLK